MKLVRRSPMVSRLPVLLALVTAAVLMLGLSGCQTAGSDSYEREITESLTSADLGISDVEVTSSFNGFTRNISVTSTFQQGSLTTPQLKSTLTRVDRALSGHAKSNLVVLFHGPGGDPVDGFGAAVEGLGDVDELAGRARSGDEYPALYFNPVSDLSDLVAQFEGGK